MQHDEDRERDLHYEEDDVEDDQHESCPTGPPNSGVGGQQTGLDLLSLFQSSQEKSIEYRDQNAGQTLDKDNSEPEEDVEVNAGSE